MSVSRTINICVLNSPLAIHLAEQKIPTGQRTIIYFNFLYLCSD